VLHNLAKTYRKTGFLHHAYLLLGDRESVLQELLPFLQNELKVSMKGNPDFSHTVYDTFGIDDGRKLKEIASRKAVTGRQVTIIACNSITREAQNALLKLFEEPTKNTFFFVIIKTSGQLLPTLRSRFFEITYPKKTPENNRGETFLQMSPKERLEEIKPIIEEKNKSEAEALLDDVEYFLRHSLLKNHRRAVAISLKEIEKHKSSISLRGSSVKMILEHLALTL